MQYLMIDHAGKLAVLLFSLAFLLQLLLHLVLQDPAGYIPLLLA